MTSHPHQPPADRDQELLPLVVLAVLLGTLVGVLAGAVVYLT